jgi:hypothetical protein
LGGGEGDGERASIFKTCGWEEVVGRTANVVETTVDKGWGGIGVILAKGKEFSLN